MSPHFFRSQMTEIEYVAKLTDKLHALFPGSFVMRNDPRYWQGLPDILVLWHDKWAMLEVKMGSGANVQPNQVFYISLFNDMSFASFINPENEEDVLRDLQQAFGPARKTRITQS